MNEKIRIDVYYTCIDKRSFLIKISWHFCTAKELQSVKIRILHFISPWGGFLNWKYGHDMSWYLLSHKIWLTFMQIKIPTEIMSQIQKQTAFRSLFSFFLVTLLGLNLAICCISRPLICSGFPFLWHLLNFVLNPRLLQVYQLLWNYFWNRVNVS